MKNCMDTSCTAAGKPCTRKEDLGADDCSIYGAPRVLFRPPFIKINYRRKMA
jgi:hypothetical protein